MPAKLCLVSQGVLLYVVAIATLYLDFSIYILLGTNFYKSTSCEYHWIIFKLQTNFSVFKTKLFS